MFCNTLKGNPVLHLQLWDDTATTERLFSYYQYEIAGDSITLRGLSKNDFTDLLKSKRDVERYVLKHYTVENAWQEEVIFRRVTN